MRDACPAGGAFCTFSFRFVADGDLRRAAVAASARRCTSRVSSASSSGVRGMRGVDGFLSLYGPPAVSGVVGGCSFGDSIGKVAGVSATGLVSL